MGCNTEDSYATLKLMIDPELKTHLETIEKELVDLRKGTHGLAPNLIRGIFYGAGSAGFIKKITPILQVTASKKSRNRGLSSSPQDSGYSQAFFAPAIEIQIKNFRLYTDVELPIYRNVNGNQLAISRIYKVILSRDF